jgi:Ca2+-binding RTX toxin-like protein
VAGVVEGSQQRIYIDGQLENTTARGTTAVTTNDFGLWIGANDEMPGRNFNGALSDVRVWGTARSASRDLPTTAIPGWSATRRVLAGKLGSRQRVRAVRRGPQPQWQRRPGHRQSHRDDDSGDVRRFRKRQAVWRAGNDVLRGGAGTTGSMPAIGTRDAVYGGIGHDLLHADFSGLIDGVTVGGSGRRAASGRSATGTSNTIVFSRNRGARPDRRRRLTTPCAAAPGTTFLRGGDGVRLLRAGYGVRIHVYGGTGHDLLHADFSGLTDGVTVGGFGPSAHPSIRDGTSNTLLFSEIEERDLTGGDGNDALRGGGYDDILRGGDGDDYFDAGTGVRDAVYGGTGHDRLHADFSGLTTA